MNTKNIDKLKYMYTLNEFPFSIESMLCIESEASYDRLSKVLPTDIKYKLLMIKSNINDDCIFQTYYGGSHTYNTIPDNRFKPDRAYTFVLNIVCEEETDTVIMTHQHGNIYYLWVNEEYIGRSEYDDTIQLTLKRGNNYFCFYMQGLSSPPQMFIRVSKLSEELKSTYTAAAGFNNCGAIAGRTQLFDIEYSWHEKGIYRGMLSTFNQVGRDISKPVSVRVLDYYSANPYYTGSVKFNIPFEIDLSCIERFSDERLNFFRIRFDCPMKDGSERYIERFFSFEPIQTSRQKLNNEAERILKEPGLLESTRNLLRFRIDDTSAVPDDAPNLPDKFAAFKNDINGVISDEYVGKEYHSGLHFMFYRSKIDNQWLRYAVYLPEDYDKNKQYPLLIHYATSQWHNPTSMLKLFGYKSDAIIANIPSRGVTVGNCLAEATMDEVLSDIYRTFNVDKTRVSAMGYSSGGASAWIQAELRPDMFAAISPSGGYFCPELLGNLKNMSIYDIESPTDEDHWRAVQNCMSRLSENPNYSLIEAKEFVHTMLGQIYVNRNIMKELTDCRINEFPDEIDFTVINNRHLKAYWITIHSITNSAYYGRILAKVSGNDAIEIECGNITGLNIKIPPQITAETIRITINQTQTLTYNRKDNGDNISIVRSSNGKFSLGEQDRESFNIYHGMGLLDVFMKPVRIINLKPESEPMSRTALKYSSPTTNAYDKQIYVNYPIYTPDNIDVVEAANSSLIVLDCNCSSSISNYLKDKSVIGMNAEGFTYQGNVYLGSYCIMQIIKHSENAECTILYVNSNDEKMYSQNFFTREMIIPMYGSYHPYLNNAALIFWERKYYKIFEYGCDMEEVK